MALSDDFLKQLHRIMPDEEACSLADAIANTQPSVSIRVNKSKGAKADAHARRVPWCEEGIYLDERPQFTFDTDFQSGRYYVQDASSMFIGYAISKLVTAPVRYLDLCAAPGGKTTSAIDALPQGSLVVANEIVPLRAKILKENVVKWGSPYTVVTHNRPADFSPLKRFFDVIATDVPCSGEGMMRKDDEAVEQWTPQLVEECAARQRSIIADIWECLRPGGLLIYSTCTYNLEENERMVRHICQDLGGATIDLGIDASWRIHGALEGEDYCYRFMPHRTEGEGLFLSVIRKEGDAPRAEVATKPRKSGKAAKTPPVPAEATRWLQQAEQYDYSVADDAVIATPACYAAEIALLGSTLKVLHRGVELAALKGKNCVPVQSLALCSCLRRDAFARADVDYATAVAYLRGESVVLADAPRGYVLLYHNDSPIGFVNNLGNRANNLYPKEWRIRSTYVPAEKPRIVD